MSFALAVLMLLVGSLAAEPPATTPATRPAPVAAEPLPEGVMTALVDLTMALALGPPEAVRARLAEPDRPAAAVAIATADLNEAALAWVRARAEADDDIEPPAPAQSRQQIEAFWLQEVADRGWRRRDDGAIELSDGEDVLIMVEVDGTWRQAYSDADDATALEPAVARQTLEMLARARALREAVARFERDGDAFTLARPSITPALRREVRAAHPRLAEVIEADDARRTEEAAAAMERKREADLQLVAWDLGLGGAVTDLAVSPDGLTAAATVAGAMEGGPLRLIPLDGGGGPQEAFVLGDWTKEQHLWQVAYLPDGRMLAAGTASPPDDIDRLVAGTRREWQTPLHRARRAWELDNNGDVHVLTAEGRHLLDLVGLPEPVASLAVADGVPVAATRSGTIYLWRDGLDQPPTLATFKGKLAGDDKIVQPSMLAVSPDGQHAVAATPSSSAHHFDLAGAALAGEMKLSIGPTAAAVADDGTIALGTRGGVLLYEPGAEKPKALLKFRDESFEFPNVIAFLPDGRLLTGEGLDISRLGNARDVYPVRLLDPNIGEVRRFDLHQGPVLSLAVLHDGRVLSGDGYGSVYAWRLPPAGD